MYFAPEILFLVLLECVPKPLLAHSDCHTLSPHYRLLHINHLRGTMISAPKLPSYIFTLNALEMRFRYSQLLKSTSVTVNLTFPCCLSQLTHTPCFPKTSWISCSLGWLGDLPFIFNAIAINTYFFFNASVLETVMYYFSLFVFPCNTSSSLYFCHVLPKAEVSLKKNITNSSGQVFEWLICRGVEGNGGGTWVVLILYHCFWNLLWEWRKVCSTRSLPQDKWRGRPKVRFKLGVQYSASLLENQWASMNRKMTDAWITTKKNDDYIYICCIK